MDPSQYNFFLHQYHMQNSNHPQDQNSQNAPPSNLNPMLFQNQPGNNREFYVPFPSQQHIPQPYQYPFPSYNPPYGNASIPSLTPNSEFSKHDDSRDLNIDDDEVEDVVHDTSHWRWEEDKLLISAWLNVSIDPMVGNDQKCDAFWTRIMKYCEETNPGVIKRGKCAITKRWGRINQGVQRFGSCYDQATRKKQSGSNNDNLMEEANQLFEAKYKVKCNFVKHWNELKREPKWRSSLNQGGGSKRTKNSASGAYSSSSNQESQSCDNVDVESPIRPIGTKAAKRRGKGKAKAIDEEKEEIRSAVAKKLDLMQEMKEIMSEKVAAKKEKNEIKRRDTDMQILYADTSKMSREQREVHARALEVLKAKYFS